MTESSTGNSGLVHLLQQQLETVAVPAGTTLLKQGGYVHAIPVVTKGVIRVFTRSEEKDLLLYYIHPGESCIMSFSACLRGQPSEVFAVAEEAVEVVLIPAEKLNRLLAEQPVVNQFFYGLYHTRYHDLIHTIQQLMYERLDTRLLNYLKQKQAVTGNVLLHLTHQQVANELGTSREVVSRLLKKMEREGRLELAPGEIRLLRL